MIDIPGYSVKREIGVGGMASVYLAVQTSLDREVALKVMVSVLAADPNFSKRFLQEARTLASLAHPNIVAVYDVGVTPSQLHYFSMQYLPNGDFVSRVSRGIDERELVHVIAGVARALNYAHQRGFVHRDVAPGNILFDANSNPVLTDFGIALAASQSSRITSAGFSVGTSHYMSPEQARGGDVDARADLYSLGVLTYYGLTGKPPYDGADGFAVAYAHVFEPIPRLDAKHAHWQPLMDRALAKDPKDRYANIDQFLDGLAAVVPQYAALFREGAVDNAQAAPAAAAQALSEKSTERFNSPMRAENRSAAAPRSPAPAPTAGKSAKQSSSSSVWIRVIPVLMLLLGAGLIGEALYKQFGKPVAKNTQAEAAAVAEPAIRVPASESPSPPPAPRSADTAAPGIRAEQNAAENPAAPAMDGTAEAIAVSNDPVETVENRNAEELEALDPAGLPTVVDPVVESVRLGRVDLAAQRLTTPPGNNAFERFSYALKLDPKNKSAKQGIVDVARKYFDLAERARAGGDFAQFAQYLDRTVEVAKAVPEGLDLLKEAAEKRGKQATLFINEAKTAVAAWNKTGAKAAYQKALAVDPANVQARDGLKQADNIGEAGYVFHDALSDGAPTSDLVILAAGKIAMQRHEVTKGEFRRFWSSTGSRLFSGKEPSCRDRESIFRSSRKRTWENPDIVQNDGHPVVCVSWEEAATFAKWLSKETGKRYRLPSPSEWEQVARRAPPADCKNANLADAAFKREFDSRQGSDCDDGYAATSPTGHFDATAMGVYDIDGNVREWVGACGNGTAAEAAGSCRDYMVKGRGWLSQAGKEPVSVSDTFTADVALNSVGFRLVREMEK